MDGKQTSTTQTAATVLGTISVLLGLGVVVFAFYQGEGLHGGGLISIALGLLAIVAGRAGGSAT
jgi:uncharacterized membrane protein YkgB